MPTDCALFRVTTTALSLRRRSLLLPALAAMAVIFGCGASASGDGTVGSPRVLSSVEAKNLLLELPYHYRWRDVELPPGATGALAGRAIGKHRTFVHFGISLGKEPEPVSVPQSGTRNPYYYYGGGFVFTDDIVVPHGVGEQIHTAAQWDEANRMVVAMQEELCKAATGEPCPI